jgi:hypothetical protein
MAGPFNEYVPPGVYSETVLANDTVSLPGDIRLAILYGVADEVISRRAVEMVRGSSAVVDFRAVREDVSARFLDTVTNLPGVNTNGLLTSIKVRNFPIVDGSGNGVTTNDPVLVTLEVDGNPWPIDRVVGETGVIHLATLIPETANVRATYYYSKRDAEVTYTFPVDYTDGVRVDFFLPDVPVVDGTGAGITTIDVAKIAVTVDGLPVIPDTLDGATGHFVLPTAPDAGTEVAVTYFTNTYVDTADKLPDEDIAELQLVGLVPDRADYSLNRDYVLENDFIQWGPSHTIRVGVSTSGATIFGDTQILASLADSRMFMADIGTGNGTLDTFTLPLQPVDGTGRAKVTDNPSHVQVYVGATVAAALVAGPVLAVDLNGTSREVMLADAPAPGDKVYATFYYSLLTEETYTFEVLSDGPSLEVNPLTAGTYSITGATRGRLASVAITDAVVADANYSVTGPVFPSNTSDLQVLPGRQLDEVVTITFTSPTAYTVTSTKPNGSSGTGVLGQTFVATKTGLRFTLLDPNTTSFVTTPYSFAAADTIEITVTDEATFKASTAAGLQLPGVRLTVTDTVDCADNDTALVQVYKMIGNPEPEIGETYYVNYTVNKTDYSQKIFTDEADILAEYGAETAANTLVMAARLHLLQGAQGVVLKQIKRLPGKTTASNRSFMDAIAASTKPMAGNIRPYIHVPLTEEPEVHQYLSKFLKNQAAPKVKNNTVAIYGHKLGTTALDAADLARKIANRRMRSVYAENGGAVYETVDALGRTKEIVVGGSLLAAAFAGVVLSTEFDLGESMTLKQITGFKRLLGNTDPVLANQAATNGVIILTDLNPGIEIRDDITTDGSNVLTREPYVTQVGDLVESNAQAVLKPFVGKRRTDQTLPAAAGVVTATLETMRSQSLLEAVKPATAKVRSGDPTIFDVVGGYIPKFSTKWIYVRFEVSSV